LRQPADSAKDFLHRRGLAENLWGPGRRFERCRFPLAFVQRSADEVDRLVDIKRLWQVFVCATLKGGYGGFQVRVRGHHDDGDARMTLLHSLQQLQSRRARHPDIRDKDLGRPIAQRVERVRGRRKRYKSNSFPAQCFFKHPPDRAVVIDDPDWLHQFPDKRRSTGIIPRAAEL
jgi:hypothetical protein